MKKYTFILSCLLLFSLTGCGDIDLSGKDNSTSQSQNKPELPDNNIQPEKPEIELPENNGNSGDKIPWQPLQPAQPKSLKKLFLNGFGDDPNSMYFALHIKGHSTKNAFKQEVGGIFGQSGTAYVKDLEAIVSGGQGSRFPFHKAYTGLGIADIYSVETGFADKEGNNFDMKFYFGAPIFKVPLNSKRISFYSFVIQDMYFGGLGGSDFSNISFTRCNTGQLELHIPAENKYDSSKHKNIALFTIDFDGDKISTGNSCSYTVTFDGFVKK